MQSNQRVYAKFLFQQYMILLILCNRSIIRIMSNGRTHKRDCICLLDDDGDVEIGKWFQVDQHQQEE